MCACAYVCLIENTWPKNQKIPSQEEKKTSKQVVDLILKWYIRKTLSKSSKIMQWGYATRTGMGSSMACYFMSLANPSCKSCSLPSQSINIRKTLNRRYMMIRYVVCLFDPRRVVKMGFFSMLDSALKLLLRSVL